LPLFTLVIAIIAIFIIFINRSLSSDSRSALIRALRASEWPQRRREQEGLTD
jgi:ABC-type dipeptide/oligopeptide/nickel transport system permease component